MYYTQYTYENPYYNRRQIGVNRQRHYSTLLPPPPVCVYRHNGLQWKLVQHIIKALGVRGPARKVQILCTRMYILCTSYASVTIDFYGINTTVHTLTITCVLIHLYLIFDRPIKHTIRVYGVQIKQTSAPRKKPLL